MRKRVYEFVAGSLPVGSRCCIVAEKSDMEPFLEFIVKDRDAKDIRIIGNDVSLLFRLQKLREFEQFDVRNLTDLIGRFRETSPDIMKGVSDKEMLDTIKSRYLQSPAEVIAWSDYLEQNMDILVKSALRERAEREILEREKQVAESQTAQDPGSNVSE